MRESESNQGEKVASGCTSRRLAAELRSTTGDVGAVRDARVFAAPDAGAATRRDLAETRRWWTRSAHAARLATTGAAPTNLTGAERGRRGAAAAGAQRREGAAILRA